MSAVVRVRRPAVAGAFYPADRAELTFFVDALLAEASRQQSDAAPVPKALIVPHAGYQYSGPVAAAAYVRLAAAKGRVSRAVIVGPAHRVWFEGVAASGADGFETPLGTMKVGGVDLARVGVSARAHADEHSLEVQLPFIQRTLGDVEIVPLLAGDASAETVASVLDALWGGDETVVLVSSDLSHYHAWDDAQLIDSGSADQIGALGPPLTHDQACGATPINGLLEVARRRRLRVERLDLRNSGDTSGSRDRVVGYGAFAFHEDRGRALLTLARQALETAFDGGRVLVPAEPWLQVPAAVFVTLRQRPGGQLRGCVGSVEAERGLGEAVVEMARAAAFRDPRFRTLEPFELASMRIDVSVLSPLTPLPVIDETDACLQLERVRPGIVLSCGDRSGVFLPKVWESVTDGREFLRELKIKAGLPPAFWSRDITLDRFTCEEWAEEP